jgi:hypothetical protein
MTVRSMLRTTRKPFRSVLSHILRATARSTTASRSAVPARVGTLLGRPLLGPRRWSTQSSDTKREEYFLRLGALCPLPMDGRYVTHTFTMFHTCEACAKHARNVRNALRESRETCAKHVRNIANHRESANHQRILRNTAKHRETCAKHA